VNFDLQNSNVEKLSIYDDKEEWLMKYAKLASRKAFLVSSGLKLDPHDPSCIGAVISTPL
jgi:hypothetical protein